MSKIAIVVDSTGCIDPKTVEELNIFISYIVILFGTEALQEFKEVTPEMFVQKSGQMKDLPSTSQPSPGQVMELYDSIFAEGFEEIIHIAISEALSGTYQNAVNVGRDYDGKVHVVNSRQIAFPQGNMAVQAAKMAQAGKSAAAILSKMEELSRASGLAAAIADLTNLKKGGRLSNASAALGGLLNIKPIIAITPEGKVEAVNKVRTFKKALKGIVSHLEEQKLTDEYELCVLHMENPKDAAVVHEELTALFPNIDIQIRPISLVLAVHAGPGAVAIGWGKKA
ncbi:MAG: DegV family protein [Turicibacter sp.]|nr:DegV family protein [Turicibacter sp.]